MFVLEHTHSWHWSQPTRLTEEHNTHCSAQKPILMRSLQFYNASFFYFKDFLLSAFTCFYQKSLSVSCSDKGTHLASTLMLAGLKWHFWGWCKLWNETSCTLNLKIAQWKHLKRNLKMLCFFSASSYLYCRYGSSVAIPMLALWMFKKKKSIGLSTQVMISHWLEEIKNG